MPSSIQGKTAADIAGSIRTLVDSGALAAGAGLPPSRELAVRLGVNRNTVVSAYRQLSVAGVAVTNRGGGTTIAPTTRVTEEGFSPDTALRDISSGNPDRDLLPDPARVRLSPARPPVLYGESTIDPDLAEWADRWFSFDQPRPFRLTVTNGAVDAIEKLLDQALSHGDAVALEDPCFLTSINAVRRAGYRPVPVPIDAEGMTADGLRQALEAGVRAVVCTPRAHNPTGVSLSARRAGELQDVLADYPHVLVIEDDHFSLLSTSEYRTIIAASHERWALVRSMSKFLGPDLRIALVVSDEGTAQRFASHISAGSKWVSHLLQRTAHAMLADEQVRETVTTAATHYRTQNARFIRLLGERGISSIGTDGLNVWVDASAGGDAHTVAARLARLGWVVRTGDSFALTPASGSGRLRMTVHALDDDSAALLIDSVVESVAAP
ncbi:aminotransferase class I/II-fold pyridoxal phosphate-dependent enzyme [Aeromicrobium sp. P5_D10]